MPANTSTITLLHNPRCSKSRSALALLHDKGLEPNVVEYLKTPPSKAALKEILAKLGMKPLQIVRKGEDIYKQQFAKKTLSDDQWLEVLEKNPILIERPIAIRGDRAVIGRPPEEVLKLL
jgi:arsenate reductase (glutaredoxin)